MNKILHHYDNNHLPISALAVLPIVIEQVMPKSVVDVGCGVGQWLQTIQQLGINDVLGIDGSHVDEKMLRIKTESFAVHNLEKGNDIRINRKFDLAISLEVAEHLEENSAEDFVQLLTRLSDRILFSAAIPNQTGENHKNEKPHIYWRDLFRQFDFEMLDIIRPIIWNNEKVNWWYRQNMFLIVKKNDSLYKEELTYNEMQLVHPELLGLYVNELNKSKKPKKEGEFKFLSKVKRIFGQ
jgi:SAM-dependent methyltransferase